MCCKPRPAALTSVAVQRKNWGDPVRVKRNNASILTICTASCDAYRASLQGLGSAPARGSQDPQQETAAGNTHQTENPVPKPPRIRVDTDQGQALVQAPQWLMHDRARGFHGCDSIARHEGKQRSIGIPFDTEIHNGRLSESPRSAV